MLEKTTADAQLQQLQLQQLQLKADIAILQDQLGWLLHTEEKVIPVYTDLKLKIEQGRYSSY